MKEESKQCYNCKHFVRYYINDITEYKKTKCGRCCTGDKHVTIHETCENFAYRIRRKRFKEDINICLNDLLAQIKALRQMVEEEYNDEEL